ncbi:MAG: hypothetical protein H6748_13795 [Spirochaetaceae bacterium]|nr:hypothetical protein [Myxococcales bacterium]MCB9725118.1 hypothetical protein [Spirochaetaceae bacterium]HPG28234.1 hypothetical protein [Myxococcota bacterium]
MIELVDPRGAFGTETKRLAMRVGDPARLHRIGFLSNEPEHPTGPHFPGYARILSRALRARLGAIDLHLEIKPVLSRPAESELLARFLEDDAVLNGLAK